MNLLLLLSAILSALTGVSTNARAAVPASVAQPAVVARAIAPAARTAAVRPAVALPTPSTVAQPVALDVPLVSYAPLYASRRRE